MGEPEVSVLIATRDRADHLRASLTGVLASSEASPFPTELVIVDNGSSDHTARVLAEFSEGRPALRVISDPVAGKSGALNRAMPRVHGRAIVFTDDDVHVPVSWVEDMVSPIINGEADAVCGRLLLAPHLDRPWLTPALRTNLAEITDTSGTLPGMVGANMAASSGAARAIGFDEELGPGGLGFAEDVLFNLRLKAAGYRLVGCAGPPVEHHLDPERLTHRAMARLAVNNGASHAYLWHHWLHEDLNLLGLRRLRASLQLQWLGRRRPGHGDGMSEAEYDALFSRSFCSRLAVERQRAPNYPPPVPVSRPTSGAASGSSR